MTDLTETKSSSDLVLGRLCSAKGCPSFRTSLPFCSTCWAKLPTKVRAPIEGTMRGAQFKPGQSPRLRDRSLRHRKYVARGIIILADIGGEELPAASARPELVDWLTLAMRGDQSRPLIAYLKER